ncbi:MAG TPA: hypothetical protein VKR56_14625 [Candidatus Cybelea sp.]|nr:hypothetical protein [Candidatus Cybelea sp.]
MPNARSALAIGAALLWLGGCSQAAHSGAAQPSPAPRVPPRPAASQRAGGVKAGQATATPAPTASAPPASTPPPSPTVTPPKLTAKVRRLPPNAAPQILDIAISETTVHPGDTVSGSVVTSSNVASVEARIGGYAMTLVKTGMGKFALTYTVAPLPWFIRGTFMMRVIAKNTRGDTVERSIPLTVR